jgi:hypothetical protein
MENRKTEASDQADAIARCDDEGGGATSFEHIMDTQVSGNGHAERMAGAPVSVDQLSAEDQQILGCLGAAVIMRWGTLPTKIQRELFEHATSLADLTQTAQRKGQIARFLHNHKDDAFPTPRQGMA